MADDGVELELIQTTMSKKLAERAEKLKRAGKFTESYLSNNDNNANIISVCTVMGVIKMPLHISSRMCTNVYHMQQNLLKTRVSKH